MPIGTTTSLLDSTFVLLGLRIFIFLMLTFYAIFALLIVRQVDLMSKALITPISPIVKALAIIHAGFAIGFIFLAFGLL